MLKQLLVPAALAVTVLGAAVQPAAAGRDYNRHGYYGSGYYGNRNYTRQLDRYSMDRTPADWGANRRRVAERARRLYREGRLTRDHYERTMDKLYDRGGSDWVDDVNDTLNKWSESDRRRR